MLPVHRASASPWSIRRPSGSAQSPGNPGESDDDSARASGRTTLSRLDSEFQQIGCIGRGGFADVFLARKRRSGRQVAIKSFRFGMEDDGLDPSTGEPESFTRELETVLQLNSGEPTKHDSHRDIAIVWFEDWFTGPGFAWIIMNYIDGGTLAQEIDSKSASPEPYTERRIAWYALQLSEALAFAHERGVAHHDVKSSNVLIDRSGGGKLLLADFGSAVAPGDEIETMTEIYASPEFLNAYNNDDLSSLEPTKIDAFGLGCILFEMLCCQKLVHLTGDQTLAEYLKERQSADAALQLPCLRLPWLPPPGQPHQPTTSSVVGYSDALKCLVKTLLEPHPIKRWTPSQLQKPLRQDPQSPLLLDHVVAAQPALPGAAVTVDNVQLGMFVQRGRDWDAEDHDTDCATVGVVVKLDPDAGYTDAVFPSRINPTIQPVCYRIGAGNKFELKVGPTPLVNFFANSGEVRTDGFIFCESASTFTVGQYVNEKCMVVGVHPDRKRILVAPMEKILVETLAPPNPTVTQIADSFADPRKPDMPPDTWQPDGGLLVALAEDSDEKIKLVQTFYSLEGGMDIQFDEIVAIHRIQCDELWTVYAQTKEDVAAENWGLANEQRLFHGTARFSPEALLNHSPNEFYQRCHTGDDFQSSEISFSHRASLGDRRCHRLRSGTKQMMVSRVALGRVCNNLYNECLPSFSHMLSYHSTKKNDPFGGGLIYSIRSPTQAFPEYLITYRSLPRSNRRTIRARRPGEVDDSPPIAPQRGSSPACNVAATTGRSIGQNSVSTATELTEAFTPTISETGKKNASKEASPNTKMCVVCLDRPVRSILIPCGHPCLCQICSTEQGLLKLRRRCPECRTKVDSAAKFFGRVVND